MESQYVLPLKKSMRFFTWLASLWWFTPPKIILYFHHLCKLLPYSRFLLCSSPIIALTTQCKIFVQLKRKWRTFFLHIINLPTCSVEDDLKVLRIFLNCKWTKRYLKKNLQNLFNYNHQPDSPSTPSSCSATSDMHIN